jgi:probable addiction module antidote protein
VTRGRRVSAAEFLDNDAVIAEYLGACLEDPNPDVFLSALAAVARAKGMTNVAHASGLGRESLYKALSPGAHPRHEAIQKVVHALGFTMTIIPATTEAREEAV